ncbi:MAG: hypothetical protein FJX75_22525 [Armatimonadetes bacterium]|nr:hypothetical protein [Armatimonadota bacterium]
MRPVEVVEQCVMIAILLAWLVWAIGLVPMPWFRDVLYFATPPPLILILVLRVLRYRQAVREAESIAEQRGRADGPFKMK